MTLAESWFQPETAYYQHSMMQIYFFENDCMCLKFKILEIRLDNIRVNVRTRN